jgi:hypothetical protein
MGIENFVRGAHKRDEYEMPNNVPFGPDHADSGRFTGPFDSAKSNGPGYGCIFTVI